MKFKMKEKVLACMLAVAMPFSYSALFAYAQDDVQPQPEAIVASADDEAATEETPVLDQEPAVDQAEAGIEEDGAEAASAVDAANAESATIAETAAPESATASEETAVVPASEEAEAEAAVASEEEGIVPQSGNALSLTEGSDAYGSITEWMLKGDFNRDGVVNSTDANDIDRYVLGLTHTSDPLALEAGDIDGDGSVDTADERLALALISNPILPDSNFDFRVVDTPTAGYQLKSVTITTSAGAAVTLTPAAPTSGNYQLVIGSNGVATVTGESLASNDIRFVHEAKELTPATEYQATYTVSGDVPAGYAVPVDSTDYAVGATVTVAAVPDQNAYPGYAFTGWTLNKVEVTTSTMVEGGLTFEGVWKKEDSVGPEGSGGMTSGSNADGSNGLNNADDNATKAGTGSNTGANGANKASAADVKGLPNTGDSITDSLVYAMLATGFIAGAVALILKRRSKKLF